ncbi:hypothetical protein ACHQM5_023046 [Ranunculus cassubicifolius]
MEMTAFERQQWQQQQENFLMNNENFIREFAYRSMKLDPELENTWPEEIEKYQLQNVGFNSTATADVNCSISRTLSCPPLMSSGECLKKRKADYLQTLKNVGVEETSDKRIKGENEEEVSAKPIQQGNNNCKKENSKASDVPRTDYIHVRARRGQATDSHSLAERVRREKISERMRYLQDLVPGCNKIIGKAGMLDEIINYVQSLQRQVEFLSMKLASVTPQNDSNISSFFAKEMFHSQADNIPTVGMLPEVVNPPYYPFELVQQVGPCGGLDMEIHSSQVSLERTTSAPVSVAEDFLDSSCFTQPQPRAWENDLQSIYNRAFPSEPLFTGNLEATNLKMEI